MLSLSDVALYKFYHSFFFHFSYQSHSDRKRKGDVVSDRRSQKDPRIHEDTNSR